MGTWEQWEKKVKYTRKAKKTGANPKVQIGRASQALKFSSFPSSPFLGRELFLHFLSFSKPHIWSGKTSPFWRTLIPSTSHPKYKSASSVRPSILKSVYLRILCLVEGFWGSKDVALFGRVISVLRLLLLLLLLPLPLLSHLPCHSSTNYLTEYFTMLEPQNTPINEFYVVKKLQ